ncbi:hypothetical protein [Nocardioides vastitatis]|uniref:Uncharacterized protein n=1 Tax=Nocardioides vastitatis TaxID=2568655 RepID=A0ABW0ZKN1_9ACTN|nr:hypothetical protein E7Z54_06075 [Nocardioides sp.]
MDRLEAHADRAEGVIRGLAAPDATAWAPPTDLGPIPDEFIPRARLLLERQRLLLAAVPSVLYAAQDQPDDDQLGA